MYNKIITYSSLRAKLETCERERDAANERVRVLSFAILNMRCNTQEFTYHCGRLGRVCRVIVDLADKALPTVPDNRPAPWNDALAQPTDREGE